LHTWVISMTYRNLTNYYLRPYQNPNIELEFKKLPLGVDDYTEPSLSIINSLLRRF